MTQTAATDHTAIREFRVSFSDDPVRHQRLPRRALPGPAELGRARVPAQPHPLQQGGPRRPLRRLGAAAAVLRRDPRELPAAAPPRAL